jgi:hypothetical protein
MPLVTRAEDRLTFYRKKFAEQAAMACDAGFMDRELADLLGVCETTIKYVDSYTLSLLQP